LPVEARFPWLPVDARHRCLIEHEQSWHAGADRNREIRCSDLFQIKFDHHVFGDLPALGGTILQTIETILHLGNAALKPCSQGFIRQSCADDGRDNLVQVSQSLNRVGEGLLVDLGVFASNAVADDLSMYILSIQNIR
jgi:hypothetical protein